MRTKGIGPRGLGVSPLKQKRKTFFDLKRVKIKPTPPLKSEKIKNSKINLDSALKPVGLETRAIHQHKPYNATDTRVSPGLLNKLGIKNSKSDDFYYVKDKKGKFQTMQTRNNYRKNNLRPNATKYN